MYGRECFVTLIHNDTKVSFLIFPKKDIVFCWVSSHTGIKGNEKADFAVKSALDLPRTNIFLPFGKMIGMVRLRTSFILSSQSWEIGSPPTGGAGRTKLYCVVPASVIHIWPFVYLEERSSTSVWALSVYSDSSPHFGGVQSFWSF